MNSPLLYQWMDELAKRFPELGRWQVLGLALFSYGVVFAQSCTLSRVALHLSAGRNPLSMERRLQRWLANAHLGLEGLLACWVGWVLERWGQAPLLLVVDETKLSDHVAVMVVSAAYQGSAIPLLWRAYRSNDYPPEGQVGLLTEMLGRLRALVPPQTEALLLADRGLGTSPRWQQTLMAQGWDYLLRVQRSTLVRLSDGKTQPLGRLVGYGQQWFGRGQVFKKAGWRWQSVDVIWASGYDQPWCLVSNRHDRSPAVYAWRFRQEASFRDLKSDGFDWRRSRVWPPANVEGLLLVLALAMFWTLAMGTQVWHLYPLTNRQQRLSVFRLGLDALFARLRSVKAECLELFLRPDTPCLKSVVP